jgi:hypothetical protein
MSITMARASRTCDYRQDVPINGGRRSDEFASHSPGVERLRTLLLEYERARSKAHRVCEELMRACEGATFEETTELERRAEPFYAERWDAKDRLIDAVLASQGRALDMTDRDRQPCMVAIGDQLVTVAVCNETMNSYGPIEPSCRELYVIPLADVGRA